MPLGEMTSDKMAQRHFFPVILNGSTGSIFPACSSVNKMIVTAKQMSKTHGTKNCKKLSFFQLDELMFRRTDGEKNLNKNFECISKK